MGRLYRQGRRGQQVEVDITDSAPHQPVALYKIQHIRIGCGWEDWKRTQQHRENFFAVGEIAASDFAYNERMHKHLFGIKQALHRFVSPPQIFGPYGGINQDHRRSNGA